MKIKSNWESDDKKVVGVRYKDEEDYEEWMQKKKGQVWNMKKEEKWEFEEGKSFEEDEVGIEGDEQKNKEMRWIRDYEKKSESKKDSKKKVRKIGDFGENE